MNPRVILITGANGGLGCAIASAFLDESPDNIVHAGIHQRRDRIDALAAAHVNRLRVVSLDVTDKTAWVSAVDSIVSEHGRLDVLVNNAGVHDDALLAQMSDESWAKVRSGNLDAAFFGCRAVLPQMINQRAGRIINVASLSALLAPAGQANYAAAKAGVVALTQSLAKEVARIGITVNAVCPGYIATDALESMDAEAQRAAKMRVPMRRFGRPEEVAAAIRFLACADAAYITGSALKIDGGIL